MESVGACKVNCFSWRLALNRIPVKYNLSQRGIRCSDEMCSLCDEMCSLCDKEIESVDHVFAQCEFAKEVWGWISNWCGLKMINHDCLKQQIESLTSHAKSAKERNFYLVLAQAVCWIIWKTRNERTFMNK